MGYPVIQLYFKNHSLDVNSLDSSRSIKEKLIDIFCILAERNFKVCEKSGGIATLFEIMSHFSNEEQEHIFERISSTLIELLDKEKTRKVILKNFNLGKLFAKLYDIYPNKRNIDLNERNEQVLGTICKFLKKLLMSNFGLFFFLRNKNYLQYIVEVLKQPVHQKVKENLLDVIEQWFLSLLFREAPAFVGVISLYLLMDCKFYESMMQLCFTASFEKIVRRILKLFLSLAYETLDRSKIPAVNYLYQSMKSKPVKQKIFNQQDQELMKYVSKIESIFKNNSEILFDVSISSNLLE
jgi:hypothetical protein